MLVKHSVLSHKIEQHFPKHRLAVEFDEKGHKDRDEHKEVKRENAIK